MGDFTTWPVDAAATGAGSSATVAGAAAAAAAGMGAGTYCCTTAPPLLTIRTLPSASVISSSDTFDSDTRSMRVLSFRKSMGAPTAIKLNKARIYSNFSLLQSLERIFHHRQRGHSPFHRFDWLFLRKVSSAQGNPLLQVLRGNLAHFTMQHAPFRAEHHGEGQATRQVAQGAPQLRAPQPCQAHREIQR